MNNKKKNEGQTDFSYYGLYLLTISEQTSLNRQPTKPSYVNAPTVPLERMNGQCSKAIPPQVRRNWLCAR